MACMRIRVHEVWACFLFDTSSSRNVYKTKIKHCNRIREYKSKAKHLQSAPPREGGPAPAFLSSSGQGLQMHLLPMLQSPVGTDQTGWKEKQPLTRTSRASRMQKSMPTFYPTDSLLALLSRLHSQGPTAVQGCLLFRPQGR
jgi:hypothetical protein